MNKITQFLACVAVFTCSQTANSAVVDVTQLTVDNVSASITVGTFSSGASSSITPPADIIMGSYQSSILDFSNSFSGGTLDGTIYSTGSFGDPVPTASVDTTSGLFSSVDLSSLRMSGILTDTSGLFPTSFSFDTSLWPVTTTPSLSSYDHLTGDFSLTWAFSDDIMIDVTAAGLTTSQMLSTSFELTLSGTAAVVPVPAAVWLMLSGLVALIGTATHRSRRH